MNRYVVGGVAALIALGGLTLFYVVFDRPAESIPDDVVENMFEKFDAGTFDKVRVTIDGEELGASDDALKFHPGRRVALDVFVQCDEFSMSDSDVSSRILGSTVRGSGYVVAIIQHSINDDHMTSLAEQHDEDFQRLNEPLKLVEVNGKQFSSPRMGRQKLQSLRFAGECDIPRKLGSHSFAITVVDLSKPDAETGGYQMYLLANAEIQVEEE